MDVHRHADGEHSLPMFVSHLNPDLTSIAFRQTIPSDLSRRAGSLLLSGVEAVKVEALVIGREAHSVTNVKVEPRQRDFLLTDGCLPNDGRSRLFAAGLGFSSSL